jgi:hypothetical protein
MFIPQARFDSMSEAEREYKLYYHVPLGYHPQTGDILFIPDKDRHAGTYVLGVQGTGKSGLLEKLIAHDVRNEKNGVIVFDPHGSLTRNCLAWMPENYLKKTYVLDMENESHPFGVNVFAVGSLDTELAKEQARERLMHLFEMLWAEDLKQQNLPRYLRNAIITLLYNPGATLVDMHDFLTDAAKRRRMLANVTDESITTFWQANYDSLKDSERRRIVLPLVSRLENLCVGRSLVRNILGQRYSTINFRRVIEERQILFIKLPTKTLEEDASLIGTIMMTQLSSAIFSFTDVPEERRPGVTVIVDEFQHFATPDFSALFTEGRKFGIKLTIAHQFREQMKQFLQDATMTAKTIVCFRTTPANGREMAHLFPGQEQGIKPEDIEPHAIAHLLTYGSENRFVQEFIDWYLRPLQSHKRGHHVMITHGGFDMLKLGSALLGGGGYRDPVRVADPTPYLDTLLYDVMRTGNAHAAIPWEVPIGFSNCGQGFLARARGAKDHDLAGKRPFPAHLVVETKTGLFWTRPPESERDQFEHFLFYLRQTMIHLAQNPLGKKSTLTTTAVGQMLIQLPDRAAFVKSGNEVGTIYTYDTPHRVSDTELKTRLAVVREHTRAKYCHPRESIEKAIAAPFPPERAAKLPQNEPAQATSGTPVAQAEIAQEKGPTAEEGQQQYGGWVDI